MFRCTNGHESYKRQKGCTKCGEPLLEVAVSTPTHSDNAAPMIPIQESNTSSQYDNGALETPIIASTVHYRDQGVGCIVGPISISGVVNTPPIQPNEPASSCSDSPLTSPPKDPFEGVEVILEGIRQRNRNESNFRKLLETVTADGIVSMDEWKQIEALRPTVSEEFYDHWLSIHDICPPEYSGQPDIACILHWRTHGSLTANSKNLFEFKVSGLEHSSGQLLLTIADDDGFTWTSCFEVPTMLSEEFTWKPRDHGWHLLVLTGSIETNTEMIVVSGQNIRIEIEPDATKSGTVINTGAMVNHGAKVKKTSWSKWADLPLVIKKREPKLVENPAPNQQPTHHPNADPITKPDTISMNPEESVLVDSAITIIPAKGLSPRPYTIRCPNGTDIAVFFGERLVLGRLSSSATVDPMEHLGIACYLPNGDDDLESTKAISRKTIVFEHAGNMVAARNIGRSSLIIDDIPVKYEQDVYLTLGQHSTITMGATPRLQEGLKPATLSCQIIAGNELEVSLQEAFRAYDDTFLVLNKQPGALVISENAGKDTLRTLWITGAITLADITGMRRRAYEDIVVFRHASRLWLQDTSRSGSRILELSHHSLAELVSGFQVTQD